MSRLPLVFRVGDRVDCTFKVGEPPGRIVGDLGRCPRDGFRWLVVPEAAEGSAAPEVFSSDDLDLWLGDF